MKGCLHGCDVSISTVPSPGATCFYYNRLVPLVLIKYSVCSRPPIHQKYIQLHSRLQLSVLLFFPFTASPRCLFAAVLSPFPARVKCACLRVCAACAHEDTIRTDAFFWFWCFHHQCHTWQLSSQNTITLPLTSPTTVTSRHRATSEDKQLPEGDDKIFHLKYHYFVILLNLKLCFP